MNSNCNFIPFNSQEFNQFILDQGILGLYKEPVQLSSGKYSNYYINWRCIGEDVYLIDVLSDMLIRYVLTMNLEVDCFYGVPEGGTKLALITQYKWAKRSTQFQQGSHSMPMGRAKPKEHGPEMSRLFLGEPKGKVLLIEDVVTTGNSLLKQVDFLREKPSLELMGVLVLTDRMEEVNGKLVRDIFKEKNVNYYALSNSIDLLAKMR